MMEEQKQIEDLQPIYSVISSETIKIVVVGPGGSGKSSVILSMFKQAFDNNIKSTNCYEVNRKTMDIDGKEIELRIWDCSAYHDQSYSTVKKAFYRGSSCALLVLDLNDQSQIMRQVEECIQECRENEVYSIQIIGNKLDIVIDEIQYTNGIKTDFHQIELTQSQSNHEVEKIQNHRDIMDFKNKFESLGLRVYLGSCKRLIQGCLSYEKVLVNILQDLQNKVLASTVTQAVQRITQQPSFKNYDIIQEIIPIPEDVVKKKCYLF